MSLNQNSNSQINIMAMETLTTSIPLSIFSPITLWMLEIWASLRNASPNIFASSIKFKENPFNVMALLGLEHHTPLSSC